MPSRATGTWKPARTAASCGYTPAPDDPAGVVNASAYRAFLLTKAGIELSEPKYLEAARRNRNFVIASQNQDGSWYYSIDGERDFVDHFHTCFVMKALAKIEQLTGSPECHNAIERGVRYYVKNLVDAQGLPVPFSKRPRMTVYRRELYDYAECINLGVLLEGAFRNWTGSCPTLSAEVLGRWRKRDGSFRARQLLMGWDNVPMHRWAQSQMFRSLSFLLSRNLKGSQRDTVCGAVRSSELGRHELGGPMCGICGQYNFGEPIPVWRRDIEAMTRSLVHRGPDDEGYYIDGPLGLGFRRLSIIDLGGGHQPMSDQQESVWVVFNGEIYNFQELKSELEGHGHIFRTKSDTEVIIHGYKQWGDEVLNRLNGMFGLAIWDVRKKRLVLARDPFGIKLLYYRIDGGRLYFGSEMRAVRATMPDTRRNRSSRR